MNAANPSRPLRIAQVAPLWNSVPPVAYGGIELMIHLLTEELVRRGHEVTLFASGDSRTSATLRAVCEYSLVEACSRGQGYDYHYYFAANVCDALREADRFDIIHCHVDNTLIPASLLSKTPVLHTLHTGLAQDDEWLLLRYPQIPVVAISHSQLAAISVQDRPRTQVIHHGCDFDAYDLSTTPGRYLAFLGRMGPHKSPLGAIRIAKKVGLPIVLAGKPESGPEEAYFSEVIKPLIDGKDIVYIGAVNHGQKNDLLKNAIALLFPIQWPEPFGIVMIEAMACGTPVVACNRGSVGEIVDAGKTGFAADSVEMLPRLVQKAASLDRRAVREHAMLRFSHKNMTDAYAQLYESLVSQATTGRGE
jgi:glycosyltransferase involved in cell wall biosynthesis